MENPSIVQIVVVCLVFLAAVYGIAKMAAAQRFKHDHKKLRLEQIEEARMKALQHRASAELDLAMAEMYEARVLRLHIRGETVQVAAGASEEDVAAAIQIVSLRTGGGGRAS